MPGTYVRPYTSLKRIRLTPPKKKMAHLLVRIKIQAHQRKVPRFLYDQVTRTRLIKDMLRRKEKRQGRGQAEQREASQTPESGSDWG